jgi:FeS assembly protein IscX
VDNENNETLSWDDSYAIARALILTHPNIDLENVSLSMIYQWTIALPDFADDPQLSNDGILSAIYQEWFEEVSPL